MSFYLPGGNLQLTAFVLAKAGWILAIASMGLANWRVWNLENTTPMISSGIAWVGIWKVCFFSNSLYSPPMGSSKICQTYGLGNSFLPGDFRAVQIILLVSFFMGMLGNVFITIALKNFYMGAARKTTTCSFFTIGGFFYLSAGICVLISIIWNFHSVFTNQSIDFPGTFYMPPKPKTQEVGNAMIVSIISTALMLIGGIFFLFYKLHINCRVHPMVTDSRWTSNSEV